jgi:hypothetical protein
MPTEEQPLTIEEEINLEHSNRMDTYFSEQQDIHPEERKAIHLRASNIFEYVPQATDQGFKLIMSKHDLEQMIMRGIAKGILNVGVSNIQRIMQDDDANLQYELDYEHLEMIASQHFLSIKRIMRNVVGDEVYDQLLHGSIIRDEGQHQLMKERDFDIILNTCKQRQDFKVYIDSLMNKLNESGC